MSEDVKYSVRSLAAARAFDRELFEELGSWGRTRYSATDSAFDTLTQFSFVWEAEIRGAGWYSIHALLRRVLRELGDDRLQEADAALEAIYRKRSQASDSLALAEAIYYAYRQEPEIGLQEWVAAFERASEQSRYEVCEALRTVRSDFETTNPWWRGRMAEEEGRYLLDRSRYSEAGEALQSGVAAFDETLNLVPDDSGAYNSKGNALQSYGDLLAGLSRYGEAEEAYRGALAAYDEALDRAPDDPKVHNNKGNALQSYGNLLAVRSRNKEAEEAYAAAATTFDGALRRSPDYTDAHYNKGLTLSAWGDTMRYLVPVEVTRARWEAAQTHFKHVLAQAPQDKGAEWNLAHLGEQLESLHA